MVRRSAAALWVGVALASLPCLAAAQPVKAAPPPAPSRQPVIQVAEMSRDGGTIEEGTVLHFRFTVANRGQADLEIRQVKPSCGCTVARWDRRIRPGREGEIEAEVRTDHFRGPVAKHLLVSDNDPLHPELDLTMTARVTPLVQVSPSFAALLTLDKQQPASHEFILERSGGRPMKIVDVKAYAPYLKTEVTPLPGVGRYKVTVTATPAAPLGHSAALVVVRTDLPKLGTVSLLVMVERGIAVIPATVYWGDLPRQMDGRMQETLTLLRRSGEFHVRSVTTDDPKLQAKLETVRDGSQYRLTLTYAGGWDVGPVRKLVTVTTDDPQQGTIEVPVQAVVTAKGTAENPAGGPSTASASVR